MSNAKLNKIFLGKKGKVYGPYTQDEFDKLHATGEIQTFTFVWHHDSQAWTPLEALPPPPEGVNTATHSRSKGISWTEIQAVCHNFQSIVCGTLDSITETGCNLLSDESSDYPMLALKCSAILNLMDPKHGKSINVKTQLFGVTRENHKWVYRLRWEGIPTFT
jgi:hypothetical protein